MRVATALLTNIAALDADTRDRLRELRPVLYASAAADDTVADLIFNKLA